MATYLELKQQAEKLMAEAENLRQKETDAVIQQIRDQMRQYGITAQDLGLRTSPVGPRSRGKATATVKYRGPNGETWSGGRGRKPAWVVQAMKDGRNMEDFAA